MKKFALFAMLICAGIVGCAEKAKTPPKTPEKTPATTPDTGGTEKPAEEKPAEPAK